MVKKQNEEMLMSVVEETRRHCGVGAVLRADDLVRS